MTGSHTRRAAVAVAAAGLAWLALLAASPAAAGDGSVFPNYTFPDGTKGFMIEATNGQLQPCFLIGFGPLSQAPSLPVTTLDLSDPTAPTFISGYTGPTFTLEWDIMGFGDGSVSPPPAPNADGVTTFQHVLGNHVFDTTFSFGPGPIDPASWVALNPQPLPPGLDTAVSFSFAQDPFMRFQVREDGQLLSFALETPEPATWVLTIAGFGLAGASLRRRTRAAA